MNNHKNLFYQQIRGSIMKFHSTIISINQAYSILRLCILNNQNKNTIGDVKSEFLKRETRTIVNGPYKPHKIQKMKKN